MLKLVRVHILVRFRLTVRKNNICKFMVQLFYQLKER